MKASILFLAGTLAGSLAQAQSSLTASDTALVGRIILAEDRRDTMDAALARGAAHSDARIRTMARRAMHRIRDTLFTARDSFPLPPSPAWPEPAWKTRFRALLPARDDCNALRLGVADSVWQVRLRAADLARASCANDETLLTAFRAWVDGLPSDVSRRTPGTASWHGAAHAIVALARLRPADARSRLPKLAAHGQWQLRMYAARAAAAMSDTATLRMLARDREANVREVAIENLSRLTGHADDAIYLAELRQMTAQSARVAAIALKGSTLPGVREAALAAFNQWVARKNASERDVRVALLEAAGKTAADDRPPPLRHELPPGTVALALGDDVRLRVTMSQPDGGASFVVRLRGDVAPMMGSRIRALANSGAYDGQSWHRVADDFVVQGGWSGANEYTGYESFFREELGLSNRRGTVGMSTRGHDTGDAQWFFNLRDNQRLDPNFTVWAEVVEGMDVVDQIMEGDRIESIREVDSPSAPAPPEAFAGTWVADTAGADRRSIATRGDAGFRVGDMGSGWGSPLTITPRADSVVIEYVFFAPYDLQPPVRLAFAANGAESVNDVMLGHATARLRSRFARRGGALEIATRHASPVGEPTEVVHRLTLESATALVVETTRRGAHPAAPTVTSTRYVRR